MKKAPRGIRNNNPCNLRLTKIAWQGKIPNAQNTDGAFEQFQSPFYGFRAAALDLKSDWGKGKRTITALISEFAPPNENNTQSYISKVSSRTGIASNLVMDMQMFKSALPALLHQIHIVENGKEYFTLDTIKDYSTKFSI